MIAALCPGKAVGPDAEIDRGARPGRTLGQSPFDLIGDQERPPGETRRPPY
jgi:hypothetical protein